MPRKLKRGKILHFSLSIVAKHRKIEGGHLVKKMFRKKSHNAKKLKGGPFSLSRFCMLRGKTFLVEFARSINSIWDNKIS